MGGRRVAVVSLAREEQAAARRLRVDALDGHAAFAYIKSLWAVDGNDTRINKVAADRKEHISDGITKVDAETVKAFGDKLIEFNTELSGTCHWHSDALIVTTVLDALATAGGQAMFSFVINFKMVADAASCGCEREAHCTRGLLLKVQHRVE